LIYNNLDYLKAYFFESIGNKFLKNGGSSRAVNNYNQKFFKTKIAPFEYTYFLENIQ